MYFYFCNSLCFLRCLFFVIFGIFLLRVYHFYSSAFERLHKQENATLFLNWTQVNIEKPPLFLDEASARTRLNELLASPTSKCTRADAQKASHGLTFHPCPAQRNDLCLLISSSNTFGSFINYLNCLKWVIFVPFGSDIVDGMRGEIEVNYLMKFDEWTSWDLSEIENPLIGTNFSATLLNLDSPKGNRKLNSETLPKTFTKITSLLSTRSLYVNFRLPKSGIGVVNEYYDWVLGNFYEKNLALIGASTSGFCQEPSKFCRYSLSFHHFERHCSDVGIPVFGLGSPIEEKNRLMLSLNQPIPKCALYFTNDRRFSFCGNISEVKLSIVHIGSSPLTIIDFPQFVSRQSKLRNIRSLEDFPSNEEIDLLLLELSASFWSKNFSLSRFSKVKQISVSLRLFVEEGENYRHFYSFVRCMRENFQLTFGEWKDDHGFLQIQAIFEALAN